MAVRIKVDVLTEMRLVRVHLGFTRHKRGSVIHALLHGDGEESRLQLPYAASSISKHQVFSVQRAKPMGI